MKKWMVILIVLASCVDEYNLTTKQRSGQLVVEGFVSNLPGPHKVKLSITTAFRTLKELSKATITIFDDTGNSQLLVESPLSPGTYETPYTYSGKVGRSYFLEIVTSDGRKYKSFLDEMIKPIPIGTMNFAFNHAEDGFDVFVESDIPVDQTAYLRWKWFGTYLKKTECCDCWITELQSRPIVSTGILQEQKKVKIKTAFVPVSPERFTEKYYVNMAQMNLSASAYSFWAKVQTQFEASSNFFQPTLGGVSGNIFSVDNPSEQVLGYFYAASITEKNLFIDRLDIPYKLEPLPGRGHCVESAYSTSIKPLFWE